MTDEAFSSYSPQRETTSMPCFEDDGSELFERLLESFSRVEKERLVDSLDRLVAELDRRTDEGIDLSRPTP